MHCQDCGYFTPDYNGGTIDSGCPNCGSYRKQPTPLHSEMEVRNMPGPAASGLEDTGGNPLKEGILADGGWNNRMKRDESFASVGVKTAADIPVATGEGGLHGDPRWALDRIHDKTRQQLFLDGQPWHEIRDTIPYGGHWEGTVSHPKDSFAQIAAACIQGANGGPLREWEAERARRKAEQPPQQPMAHVAYEDDDGWDDDENPYNPEEHAVRDRFIVNPEGKVLRASEGSYQNGEAPFHEAIAQEHGMNNGEFTQGHSLGVVHGDGSISFVQHQTPFDQEQLQQIVEPHFPGHVVAPVESTSNEERWGLDNNQYSPEERREPGFEDKVQQQQQAEQQRGGKPFGYYDNPYQNRGGSVREKFYMPWDRDSATIDADFDVEQIIAPGHHTVEVSVDGEKNPVILQHDTSEALDAAKTKLEASVKESGIIGSLLGGTAGFMMGGPFGAIRGASLGNMVGNAVGGGGGQRQPQQQQQQLPMQSLDTLSSVHEALTTDLSNPGYDDTDDPQDVDQHEHNDGEHPPETDEGVGSDGFPDIPLDGDIGKAFQDALPALIKYYDSDESGAHDPAIAHLVQLVEAEHPGLIDANHPIDDEDLNDIHAAKGHTAAVPGIGQAPGATPMGTPPANPMANAIPCPACGALGNGSGNCVQCGMPLQQVPNVQHPIGQTPMQPAQAGPPPPQTVYAANQGPHNPEQFKAVSDYLAQSTPPEQITVVLQDLINNPQNYGDILAEIQGKGTTPQPDPDPGAPPPQPPMQDPNAGQAPPGMMPPPQARTADDQHHNFQGVPAADQQQQRDVSREEDSSGYWKTADGSPLQVGSQYEMYSNQYDIPDIVRVDAVKPESLEYTLTGEYGLDHRTELTRTEAEMDGTTFQHTTDDDLGPHHDETEGDVPHQAPHAFAKVKEAGPYDFQYEDTSIPEGRHLKTWRTEQSPTQCPSCGRSFYGEEGEPCYTCQEHHTAADSIAPKCPKCDSHTTETMDSDVHPGNFSCHNCGHVWKLDGVVPTKTGKTAGAKFTPMEQREFIDEPGEARNTDKLDLSHTHYEASQLDNESAFLFGL